jgi:CHAT domain-containing protein/Flp pilus assembly protein TadD
MSMPPIRKSLLVVGLLMRTSLGLLAAPQPPVSPKSGERAVVAREESFDLLKARRTPHQLSPSIRHVYWTRLKSGQLLHVVVQQRGIDVQLDLLGPAREHLFTINSHNGIDGPEPVLLVAETPGIYQMVISTRTSSVEGRYIVQVAERRSATKRDSRSALALQGYYRGRDLLVRLNQPKTAEKVFLAAARALEESGERGLAADAWADLSNIYRNQGPPQKLIEANQHTVALSRSLGRKGLEAIALNDLALGELQIADIDMARRHFEEARRLAQETGDERTEASVLTNLGMLQAERAEAWTAERSLQRALALRRKLKDSEGEAKVLGAFGLLNAQMGQIEEALNVYQSALHLQSISQRLKATLLTQMGSAYVFSGQVGRAFQCFQQALDIHHRESDPENEASTLNGFGIAYFSTGNYRDALDPYQRALKIYQARSNPRGRSITLMNIGWALALLMRYDEARDSFDQALKVARELKNPTLEASVRFGFAWMERRRGYLNEAQRQADRALKLVESVRTETNDPKLRVAFFSGKQDIYELQIGILMKQYSLQGSQNLLAKALQISESARARSLLDNIQGRSGDFAPSALAAQEIQERVLDPDTILLEYSLGEPNSYLWLVTRDDLKAFVLPGRKEIETLANATYERLAKRGLAEEQAETIEKVHALGELLLRPVAGLLGTKRLLIVASGALQSIPFAALPDPDVSFRMDLKGSWPQPLILRHEIVYEPSASVVAGIRKTRADRQPPEGLLAVLADGVFEQDDDRIPVAARKRVPAGSNPILGYLRRLTASRKEANAITDGLPAERTLKALDFKANRDLVTSGRLALFRIIHFATHGFFKAQQADLAAIIFSHFDERGRVRDHLLRIQDIKLLKLQSDLVVLSSCRSGLGKNVPGEGVVGLPQAFLAAGSLGVVMSVWDVGDSNTADLMKIFYKNMLFRGLPPSAALKDAQIAIWKNSQHSSPWSWAGFIVQGEWKKSSVPLNKNTSGVSSTGGALRISSMMTKPSL